MLIMMKRKGIKMETPTNEELSREIKFLWDAHQQLTNRYNFLLDSLHQGRKIKYEAHEMPNIAPCYGDYDD